MALGPILPGRIPNSLGSRRASDSLKLNGFQLQKLRDQITTGQQFQLPGDSPAAALKTIIMQGELERAEQFRSNVESSRSLLATTEQSLGQIGNVFSEAQSLLLAGTGSNSTSEEKQLLAEEVDTLITSVINTANTKFRDRFLFGGSHSESAPFELTNEGYKFTASDYNNTANVNDGQRLTNNANPVDIFNPFSEVTGGDLDPALTTQTSLEDLNHGRGIRLGVISITVDTGGGPITQQIDLSGAKTVNDLKTLIETPFAGDLTVDIDPATNSGIRLTPSAGTVAVADQPLSYVAADLGIRSAAATVLTGTNLNPSLTEQTPLAALNGGAGIGPVAGTGLLIQHGSRSTVVDLSTATTVEDVLNEIRAVGLDLDAHLNAAGTGITIQGRLSGAELRVGENGGQNATNLGIRSLNSATSLTELNNGTGIPVDGSARLTIIRRDGTSVDVDLTSAQTVQDVIDAVNLIDVGNLVASFNTTGNGISILDNSGIGPLSIEQNELTESLGLDGLEPGNDPLVPLVGRDTNPQRSDGIVDMLIRLRDALKVGNDSELSAIDSQMSAELQRFNSQRGSVGRRLQSLDAAYNSIEDEILLINESLSQVFDTNLTEAITQLTNVQTYYDASQKIAVQSIQLNLFQYI